MLKADNIYVPILLKSGSLKLLELSWPVLSYAGIALSLYMPQKNVSFYFLYSSIIYVYISGDIVYISFFALLYCRKADVKH